jgi:hypothetical protein
MASCPQDILSSVKSLSTISDNFDTVFRSSAFADAEIISSNPTL